MSSTRRFSQAVSEGDGISIVVAVDGAESARRAEASGAEAVLADPSVLDAVCDAVAIPVVATWDGRAPMVADAVVVDARAFEDDDDRVRLAEELESHDVVLRVRDEDELEWVFEEIDPEIVLLAAPDADGEEALEKILDLLPDVPAGKLALAECEVSSREQVVALERAGFDGIVVPAGEIADLVGAAPPEV